VIPTDFSGREERRLVVLTLLVVDMLLLLIFSDPMALWIAFVGLAIFPPAGDLMVLPEE